MVGFEELLKRNGVFSGNADRKMMAELCKGQKPHTIVLTCSDSRVVPEFIFGCRLGELFVVRVAGNVCSSCTLASIEYAAEHLGCGTLVVLGHTNCGAICAACEVHGEGNDIISRVMPAVRRAGGDRDKAVSENVALQVKEIREGSSIISSLEKKGKLRIVGAVYDISTGRVSTPDTRK